MVPVPRTCPRRRGRRTARTAPRCTTRPQQCGGSASTWAARAVGEVGQRARGVPEAERALQPDRRLPDAHGEAQAGGAVQVGRHRGNRAPERHRLGCARRARVIGRDRSVVRRRARGSPKGRRRDQRPDWPNGRSPTRSRSRLSRSTAWTVGPGLERRGGLRGVPRGEQAPVARVGVAYSEGAAGPGAQELAEAQPGVSAAGGPGPRPSAAVHRGPAAVRTPHRSSVTSARHVAHTGRVCGQARVDLADIWVGRDQPRRSLTGVLAITTELLETSPDGVDA